MAEHSPGCTCFIIPPKMLRQLAEETPDTAERHCLLDQAEMSAHLRGQRSVAPIALGLVATATGEKRRTVYDGQNKSALPGKLVRAEDSKPSTDTAVNQAYDGAGATYDFYREVLKRNSIDNKGMRLDSTVHYQNRFNNAFWNGQQMVYGDGDGKLFLGFTSAIDVIAHELTHGVTQYSVPGGLVYQDQSGALNESISDVFGSVVKQWTLKQSVEQADWLIGPGIMAPAVGKALRSMADPGNKELTWSGDDQPKHMKGYVENGDVHTNSGIPNHAFYAAAIALKGNAWDKAGPIWYKALSLLTSNATFADMAKATAQAAVLLYGADSAEEHAVQAAWKVVGVT
ncbi:Thermolysin metallopeptidase, catalytic domain [Duganella sacchari]|uniref:Neutral metalloproteinase n=1 Tax=Duganella sacchari TaxID=551987 RepID=A0A1M7HD16_9BURK|nr:M4 family metallopeptidase [Duganella sacchari]SHM26421.1 Thermolysin metallopeptidase, catalytic domain [Duganella sacchari]